MNDDMLASGGLPSSPAIERPRQPNMLDMLLPGSHVGFGLTINRSEAIHCNNGNPVQGDGPWWTCTITPMIIVCECCGKTGAEGYFKAASHDFELSLALALSRLADFRLMTRPVNVERSEPVQAEQPQEAKKEL